MSPEIRQEIDLEFAVSNRIDELMKKYGYTKLQLAQKLGKRPSEITKWLSGQHNFTLRTFRPPLRLFRRGGGIGGVKQYCIEISTSMQ